MLRSCVIAVVLVCGSTIDGFAVDPLLEIETADRQILGKNVAHTNESSWILERDGRLSEVAFEEVTGFKVRSTAYRPFSATEVRSQLRREFGNEFEIKGTSRYLVVAAEDAAAQYGEIFEQVYREIRHHFAVRGFELDTPDYPMVAIVFPDQDQFAEYAAQDGIRSVNGLLGYYERSTNRVALYDPETSVAATNQDSSTLSSVIAKAGVSADLQETIVHEATHQVAFNVGLHSRIGETPKWVVEGLATVFEHPDMRGAARSGTARKRVNRERYVWFGNYSQNRRDKGSMKDFISSDLLFTTNVLDAYSESWALTFFLVETRGSQYAKYLQHVAQRDPTTSYTAAERVRDFERFFATSIEDLDVDFLRFFEGL